MSLVMNGVLAVGYGEKCPYCELIMLEDMDVLEHMQTKHKEELVLALFGEEK